MMLSDVLKTHPDTSCILLYGGVTDCILGRDLCYREFSVFLSEVLHGCGYDNVVFYDFTGASGKYVYDDESAYYSIHNAKSAYEAKYGGPPKNITPAPKPKPEKKPPGGHRFGKKRTVIATVDPDPPTPPQPNATDEIPCQQRNLEPAIFYGELRQGMTNQSVRTAYVFDIYSFLRDEMSGQNVHNILYQWRNPNNLIVFLHPDGKSAARDGDFLRLLSGTELYQYFCHTNGNNVVEYRPDRCFSVLRFGKDEIMRLLQRYRILCGLCVPESLSSAADKINYLLNQQPGFCSISLRQFSKLTDRYFERAAEKTLDTKFYEAVFNVRPDDCLFDPLKKLYERAGWRDATEKLIDTLVTICMAEYNKQCPETEMFRRAKWLSEQYVRNGGLSEDTRITERFNRGSAVTEYPNAALLPHMMLIGNPGTGKTTSVAMIGRVLHDLGILKSGHVRHVSAGELQAGYIGQTHARVAELLDQSENGILFIDEAYNLCKDLESPGNAGTFSQEAVNTLVNAMTDENRHMVVIFAGYPSRNPNDKQDISGVRGLYKMNIGLARRIRLELEIADYTPDTLTTLFMQAIAEKGYSLSDDLTEENIHNLMRYRYQTRNVEFGNGDYVYKLVQRCIATNKGGDRLIHRQDFGEDIELLKEITMDSIEAEFRKYPGLEETGIRIINEAVALYNNRKMNDVREPGSPKHVILVGKRGTGKTTLADIVNKAWGMAGIMSGGPMVKIENPAAVSHDKIKEAISSAVAKNTVLFIDEAHNMPSALLQDMLNPMTEYRNLTCFFAVYPERESEFLELDPGIRDRCKLFRIADYTPDQLVDIFQAIVKRQNREADSSCVEALRIWFEAKYVSRESDPHYSNARLVENVVEQLEQSTQNKIFTEVDIPSVMREEILVHRHVVPFEEIMAQFDDYVGWKNLRDSLISLKNRLEYGKLHPENNPVTVGHLIFSGNPGTGKTAAGELFARACYSLGLVKTDRFCSYGAEDLVAGFVGQTSMKTKAALQKGADGVIFIDEAYNLAYDDQLQGDEFKKNVVDVILRFCVEEAGKTIVILAGYGNHMDTFLRSNPGLSSRFGTIIYFDDFTPAECREILKRKLRKYTIAAGALDSVEALFEECITQCPDWGNARDVGAISESVAQCAINRVIESGGRDEIMEVDITSGFDAWQSARRVRS